LLHCYGNTEYLYIFYGYMYVSNNEKETCCWFSFATMDKRTRHNGTLHVVYRLSPSVYARISEICSKAHSLLTTDGYYIFVCHSLTYAQNSFAYDNSPCVNYLGRDVSRRCIACLPLHYLAWISSQFRHLCWI
jgi:hypothetical protein